MIIYEFALQTLLATLVDLGADYAVAFDQYGNSLITPNNQNGWINDQVIKTVNALIAKNPAVGARHSAWAIGIEPFRVAQVRVTAVPGGYVVAVLGLQNALSQILARRLADEIEAYASQRGYQWWSSFPSRFSSGLSRRY